MTESTSKDVHSLYLEKLSTHLLALRNLKPTIESGSDSILNEAFDSVHRIAHSLKSYSKVYGFFHVSETAQQVELANRNEIGNLLNRLIGELDKIVGSPANHKALILII